MKMIVWLSMFFFSTVLFAQEEIIKETKSLVYNDLRATNETYTINIQNAERQPFIALDLVLAFKNKASVQASYRWFNGEKWSENINIETDMHLDQTSAWRSRLIYLHNSTTKIDINIKSKKWNTNQLYFNFFYPEYTATLQKPTKSQNQETKAAPPPVSCACPIPPYQSRLDWGPNGNYPPQSNPTMTTVSHLIVHHAAGQNTSSDWAAVVRSIWNYHVNSNGWSDIGYNYMIDPNGIIYEGRGNNVVGAHFSGMNTGTMGVCLLGNYQPDANQNVQPSVAMQNSLIALLSWKECDIDKDPLLSSYHSASNLNLMHISGHRDGGGTECPGDNVYNLLPNFRNSCASYMTNCAFVSDADLVVSSLQTNPTSIQQNQAIDLILAVGNGGNSAVNENVNVSIKVDGTTVQNFVLDSLAANQIKNFTVSNYVFTSLGNHQLCAYIDAASNESNSLNNSYCKTVTVEEEVVELNADLVVLSLVQSPNIPTVGEMLSFDIQIKNIGAASTSQNTSASLQIDGVQKTLFGVPILAANGIQTHQFNTLATQAGTHQVCVTINSPSNEINTQNNSFCKSYDVNTVSNVNAISWLQSLSVAPNASQEVLTINLSLTEKQNIEFAIQNTLGQKLYKSPKFVEAQLLENIPIYNLPKGMYWLAVKVNEEVVFRKFLKN